MRVIEGLPDAGEGMSVAAFGNGCERTVRRGPGRLLAIAAVACGAWLGRPAPVPAQRAADPPAVVDEGEDRPAAEDAGVFLPSDRVKERRLDRATRLLAAGEWADGVGTLDELLADDRDAFVTAASGGGTRRSIRSEATRLIGDLPPAGRDAYALLCRSRSDRALADAVARDDSAGILAVARRWFATPAGRRAALITATAALEADDPCAAAAWLERLADDADATARPTLLLMRAAAAAQAGDRAAAERLVEEARRMPAAGIRLGGVDAAASGAKPVDAWLERFLPRQAGVAASDWLLARGNAARNAVVAATPPLLVPRYRVPLTRHPEEARMLEKRRRLLAADGGLAVPAGTPLAVGDTLVMQTPLGILGVDFETGKRVWLQSAVASTRGSAVEAALGRGFDDATSGGLSSDGVRVFAVESHPDALTPPAEIGGGIGLDAAEGRWAGGNTLTAYDTAARGAVAWRLPRRDQGDVDRTAAPDWFMGAPLVVGRDLFALVESAGQVRLDVIDAADGSVHWSQPLADLEERQAAASPDGYARRLAGLTPALDAGVLVCPLGGGTVVALDLTSRTLLWAHTYRLAVGRGDEPAGARLRGLTGELRDPASSRGGDPWPVIAAGRVFLMPYDADDIVCLGLRDGAAGWQRQPQGRRHIVGVVGGSLILVGADGVEAVAVDTGRQRWLRPCAAGIRPSGRALLTDTRVFLPVDAPGVLEIDVADGAVVGQHAVRGGGVPGNLVAVRGEVISRGIDVLDVFHQTAELESRVETARHDERRRPWADYWSGQLELTGGLVPPALDRIRATAGAAGAAPTAAADALVFALRRDFAAGVAAWRSWDDGGDRAAAAPDALRSVIDGSLRNRDDATAWRACRRLVAVADGGPRSPLISDPSELGLEVDPDRWARGRLAELQARGDAVFRGQVAAVVDRLAGHDGHLPAEPGAASRDPVADEWPLGRVVARRPVRRKSDSGAVGSQVVAVPLVAAIDSIVPCIGIAYDVQQRKLLVADGYGRRVVEPLSLEPAASLPWLNQMSPIEPSVVGRTLVVRTGAGISAFDLGAAAGENRLLWKTAGRVAAGRDLVSVRAVVGGRVARNAGLPLGRRVTEADDLDGPRATLAPPARRTGVLVPAARAAALLDPATGRVLWERQGLPAIAEWIVDDETACGCTADGLSSPVLSMCDGRLLHVVDLPGRRQRFASHGRFVVAVVPCDDGPLATRVRIDRIDPLRRESQPLGEFAGEARATMIGDGRLAVLEPDGTLTVIDVAAGTAAWRTRLDGATVRIDELHVTAWRDRYLVFAATADVAMLDEVATIGPLAGGLAAGEATAPLSGGIWAVGRDDGRPLWQAPATVRQHCLLLAQPADLPVLVLTRQTRADDGGRPELAVLVLDKRTGHAVLDEHRATLQQHLFVGCEVSGVPREHTISIRGAGGTTPAVTLAFTGEPLPPQPPFQAEGRPPAAGRGLDSLRVRVPADDGR